MTADKTRASVHHQFWCVNATISKAGGVALLTLRPLCRRKGIDPSLVVPIIHVLFERYDLGSRYRLFFLKPRKQSVRRRAARAAFRFEQFQNHRPSHPRNGCDPDRLLAQRPSMSSRQNENQTRQQKTQ